MERVAPAPYISPMTTRSDVLTNPRFAGSVRRYHTWLTHQQQSVGEHTWHVLRIYDQIWGPIPPHVTRHIIWHDAGELVTGDLPFPVKQNNHALRNVMAIAEHEALEAMGAPANSMLSPEELLRAKACDLLEMWEFGLTEKALGNMLAQPIIDDIQFALGKLLGTSEEAATVVRYRLKVEERFKCR
jgi:hypothetical protein